MVTLKRCIAAILSVLLFAIAVASCSNKEPYYMDGIDVSHHQGIINAQKVEADVVVIRMGRSGYGEEFHYELDTYYEDNVKKFLAQDKKIALYWMSHAVSLDEVAKENQLIIETYNSLSKEAKSEISYLFIDREKIDNPDYDPENPVEGVPQFIGRADYISNDLFNEMLIGQVHQLQESLPDIKVGVYTNVEFLVNIIDNKTLGNVPIWIAWWSDESNVKSFEPVIERVAEDSASAAVYLAKNIVMWQYSESGNMPGISEKVDLNIVSSKMFE